MKNISALGWEINKNIYFVEHILADFICRKSEIDLNSKIWTKELQEEYRKIKSCIKALMVVRDILCKEELLTKIKEMEE